MLDEVIIETNGERFYSITNQIKEKLKRMQKGSNHSGVLHLFIMHTSCALTISESYDPSAHEDIEEFFKQLVPRHASFIKHTCEGEDDSPSHMKSALLQQSLGLIVEQGNLILGTWQGIYLAEFRDLKHRRKILLKFRPDQIT